MPERTENAVLSLMQDEVDQAERLFELELVTGWDHSAAHAGLAICYALRNDLRSSKKELAKSLATTSPASLAHVANGIVADSGRNMMQAEADHKKALELDPKSAYARYVSGTLLSRSGRVEESINLLAEVVATNPEFWLARRNPAVSYEKGRKHGLALREAIVVLRTRPSTSNLGIRIWIIEIEGDSGSINRRDA